MPRKKRVVIDSVDTHKHVPFEAVVDEVGEILDTASFSVNATGYRDLLV